METNYGVGVKNRYDLFLDEDADPLEILKLQEEEKLKAEKLKKEKPAVKDTKAKSTKAPGKKIDAGTKAAPRPVAALTENNRGDLNKPRSDAPIRRDENRGYGGPPRQFESREDLGARGERGRGGFRGRGGPRGVGVGRGAPRGGREGGFEGRGKREYERHSGSDKTGIKAVEKRDGGGARNWGRATEDPENVDWNQTEEPVIGTTEAESPKADETVVSPDETEKKEGEGDEVTEEKAEPQEQQLTLDEWKALQAEKRNRPNFKIRRAGEGEDQKQWKNTVVLKKKQPLSDEESDEEDEDDDEEEERQQSLVNLIPIVFSSGPRRGAGGRGRGGRGGRGRGSDAPSRPERAERRNERVQRAPKVDDENDFPTLG